jgi:uncharacterized protein YecE (DUF72 family)
MRASNFPLSAPHCGIAGWQHKNWDRQVFPKYKPKGFHPLTYLSHRMDCVEIESTFVEIPRPELTAVWAAKVAGNPEFRFTVRLHRAFTHERDFSPGIVAAFREAVKPIAQAGRLGCVLMQLPSSFRFTAENREFLIRLRRTFHEFPLAAELRHASWNLDEALGTLVDYHVSIVNIDQPHSQWAMPPASKLTSRIGYFKLYGSEVHPGFHDFEHDGRCEANSHMYSAAELGDWKERIDYAGRFAEQVFVVFANAAGGRSVVNAMQLAKILDRPAVSARAPRAGMPLLVPSRAA